MVDLKLLEADLTRDEGKRSKPYRDTLGYLTIGVGHNLDAEGLCDAAIVAQLEHDIRTKALDLLDRHLPWWRTHPEPVQRALANLCFNLGIGKLLKFTTTLGHIRVRRYQAAGDALLKSLYAKQVGQRANRVASLIRSVV